MACFVLVHGAYHGGWCYARVAGRLRARGQDVHTPTLTGLGERAHLADRPINLSTHIQDIVAAILGEDLNDVILCGHSYGGMVITGVAGQIAERIGTLVYLDAAVPEDGQSIVDLFAPERALRMLQSVGETGTMIPPPDASAFGVNSADVAWVNRMCTPQPLGCFTQKLRFTGKEARVKRRTYVLAERFRANIDNHGIYARLKTRPGWKLASLDCGHDVMIDAPDALAELLCEEAAR